MSRSRSGVHQRVLVALAVFSMVGLYFCNVAQATLIAYEPFNYAIPPGGPAPTVSGQNGGFGWTGPWTTTRPEIGRTSGTTGATPNGSNFIGPGSLVGPGAVAALPTVGNHAIFTGEFGTMDGLNRQFVNVPGTDGTTTWFSFLGQRQGNTGTTQPNNPYARGANVGLFDDQAVSQGPNNFERVGLGNSSNATTDAWAIIPQGSSTLREGSANDPWSTLSWGVLKIQHIGDATVADSAWLWVNPDPLGGEPLEANADVVIIGGATPDTNARDFSNVDFVRPFVGNPQTNIPFALMVVDEIRVGTNWDDMRNTAGIPEPASCVLLILGGLAMYVRRNKR